MNKYQEELNRIMTVKPHRLKTPALLDSPLYATHQCDCGYYLIDDTYENYCAQCGKKIDWNQDDNPHRQV